MPKNLLEQAQIITGEGITETLKQGLEHISCEKAYEDMLARKNTYRFQIPLDELRADREEV